MGIIIGWLVNQLPALQRVPGKTLSLLVLVISGVILSVGITLKSFPTPPPIPSFLLKSIDGLTLPCFVLTVSSFIYLTVMSWWVSLQSSATEISERVTAIADEYESLRQKLLNVIRTDVAVRLEDFLHKQETIVLTSLLKPEMVGRPTKLALSSTSDSWWRRLQIFQRWKPESKSVETIIEIFGQLDIGGRLLILGAPGSGKTMMLIELAQELLSRMSTDPEKPLPVIFELSNWRSNKKGFMEWLSADLKDRHNIPYDVTKAWLKTRKIVPLLDGLDELGLPLQRRCIEQLKG